MFAARDDNDSNNPDLLNQVVQFTKQITYLMHLMAFYCSLSFLLAPEHHVAAQGAPVGQLGGHAHLAAVPLLLRTLPPFNASHKDF